MCRMPLWRLYRKNPLASSSEYGQCELDHSGRPLDELFNELRSRLGPPLPALCFASYCKRQQPRFGAIRRDTR
jgi:hypothetical protein